MSSELNGKLANKPFQAKKAILGSAGRAYDLGGIVDQDSWTSAEIKSRTRLLAERAYDEVWKLPV